MRMCTCSVVVPTRRRVVIARPSRVIQPVRRGRDSNAVIERMKKRRRCQPARCRFCRRCLLRARRQAVTRRNVGRQLPVLSSPCRQARDTLEHSPRILAGNRRLQCKKGRHNRCEATHRQENEINGGVARRLSLSCRRCVDTWFDGTTVAAAPVPPQ